MLIALVVAALSLLILLPLYHFRFGFGWFKALLLTLLTWFTLNTLASLLVTLLGI